jgi:hypothetical protein
MGGRPPHARRIDPGRWCSNIECTGVTMPTTAFEDPVSATLRALARAIVWTVLIVGGALAAVFAFAAAMVVALLIAGAALAMRFAPRAKRVQSEPEVLDARRTPDGWVVEAAANRK